MCDSNAAASATVQDALRMGMISPPKNPVLGSGEIGANFRPSAATGRRRGKPTLQADNCFSAIESHSAWASRRYLGARLICSSSSVEHYPRLSGAPCHPQQHAISNPGLGPGKVGCDRMVLLKRLINASDFGQCPCIEQMALGRLKIRPALPQIVQRRQRVRQDDCERIGPAPCRVRRPVHRPSAG